MLVIDVTLHSAITGKRERIASMVIANDGSSSSPTRGNYTGQTYRKGHDVYDRKDEAILRIGAVKGYPRQRLHVWNLVQRMLTQMGYK